MFELNHRDNAPIYEQIKRQLRRLIVTHAIAPGEKLPSIREIASSLAINPNTIQRAYRELESEGYIYTISGKGSYAADKTDVDQKREQELLDRFDAAATELLYLGYTKEDLVAHIDKVPAHGQKDDS